MKAFLFGIVLTAAIFGSLRILQWRLYVNAQAYNASIAFGYLNEPVIRNPNGKDITRAQALDYLIAQAVQNHPK